MASIKEYIIVIPDVHVPYHDKDAWRLALKVVAEYEPTEVVIIGDFLDCYCVSSHLKTPSTVVTNKGRRQLRRDSLESEIAAGRKALTQLRNAAGDAKITYCEGNHEYRLTRYLAERAPAMLPFGQMKTLLNLQELDIDWIPYRQSYSVGKMDFTHDVGRAGVNAARQSLLDYGGNLTFGHTHKLGTAYEGTQHGPPHVALNVGWLGNVNAIDYKHQTKAKKHYQLGFGIVETDTQGNAYANAIPIVATDTDYRCDVHGYLFSVRRHS